jgi:hypothetical protein
MKLDNINLDSIPLKITPVFIDGSNFSVNKDSVYYNGLAVAKLSYSATLCNYWLRMINIADSLSEHSSVESALLCCQQNIITWLEDK